MALLSPINPIDLMGGRPADTGPSLLQAVQQQQTAGLQAQAAQLKIQQEQQALQRQQAFRTAAAELAKNPSSAGYTRLLGEFTEYANDIEPFMKRLDATDKAALEKSRAGLASQLQPAFAAFAQNKPEPARLYLERLTKGLKNSNRADEAAEIQGIMDMDPALAQVALGGVLRRVMDEKPFEDFIGGLSLSDKRRGEGGAADSLVAKGAADSSEKYGLLAQNKSTIGLQGDQGAAARASTVSSTASAAASRGQESRAAELQPFLKMKAEAEGNAAPYLAAAGVVTAQSEAEIKKQQALNSAVAEKARTDELFNKALASNSAPDLAAAQKEQAQAEAKLQKARAVNSPALAAAELGIQQATAEEKQAAAKLQKARAAGANRLALAELETAEDQAVVKRAEAVLQYARAENADALAGTELEGKRADVLKTKGDISRTAEEMKAIRPKLELEKKALELQQARFQQETGPAFQIVKREADARIRQIDGQLADAAAGRAYKGQDLKLREQETAAKIVDLSAQRGFEKQKLDLEERKFKDARLAAQAKAQELGEAAKGDVNKSVRAVGKALDTAKTADDLIYRVNRDITLGGVGGWTAEKWRGFWGTSDAATIVRKDLNRFLTDQVLQQLPPGSLTEKEQAIIRQGFPTDLSNPAVIVEFLSAARNAARSEAEMRQAEADWVSANGSLGTLRSPVTVFGIQMKPGERFEDAKTLWGKAQEMARLAAERGAP